MKDMTVVKISRGNHIGRITQGLSCGGYSAGEITQGQSCGGNNAEAVTIGI